jgi:hypothetical protein
MTLKHARSKSMGSTIKTTLMAAMIGMTGAMAHSQDCPNPEGGDCYTETPGIGGCSDSACCITVCDFDSYCCDTEWDDTCVANAKELCGGGGGGGGGGTTGPCKPVPAIVGDNPVDTLGSTSNLDLTGFCVPGPFGDALIYNTMYFNFTPDETDTYTMSTCNQANFDTRLAVLTEACDESTVLVCLDDTDGCAGFTTTIEVDLMAGEEYTISVGGYSAVDYGTGTLTITLGSGGGGGGCEGYTNNCDSPEVLPAVGDYEFETTCAFLAGDRNLDMTGFCDPGTFGDDVDYNNYYFTFTPANTDIHVISTCNQASYDTRLAVLTDGCDPSSVIACLDDTDGCEGFTTTIAVELEAGVEYTIAVGGYAAGTYGTGTLTVWEGTDDCGGGGGGGNCDDYTNNCDNPQVVPGIGDYEIDTSCAFELGDRNLDLTGFCDPGEFGDDVDYNNYYLAFTAGSTGTYEISTCNQADYDTRLAVLLDGCDPSSVVGCLDDTEVCEGFTAQLFVELEAGTEYVIAVGGYAVGTFGTGIVSIIGDEDPPAECIGDLNMDGQVDGGDLFILLGDWDGIGGDLNGDFTTDGADLNILLGAWGLCP